MPGVDYLHDEVGYNYRLTNLVAALGLAQLEQLDDFVERKRAIAARYDAAFADLPGLPPAHPGAGAESTQWLYTVAIDPEAAGTDRRPTRRAAQISRAGRSGPRCTCKPLCRRAPWGA